MGATKSGIEVITTGPIKVFFGCSMRGNHDQVSQADLEKIPGVIEELGFVLMSKHQTQAGIIEKENQLTKVDIHDRDYAWLLQADFGVFEISNASTGVGGEIADMRHERKPVLMVFRAGLENVVSAYIQGKAGSKLFNRGLCECQPYSSLEELQAIIKQFADAHITRKAA